MPIVFDKKFRIIKNNEYWCGKSKKWQTNLPKNTFSYDEVQRELSFLKRTVDIADIKIVNVRIKTIEIHDTAWNTNEFLESKNFHYIQQVLGSYYRPIVNYIKKLKSISDKEDNVVIGGSKKSLNDAYLFVPVDTNNHAVGIFGKIYSEKFLKDKKIPHRTISDCGAFVVFSSNHAAHVKLLESAYSDFCRNEISKAGHALQIKFPIEFKITIKLTEFIKSYTLIDEEKTNRSQLSKNFQSINLS